VGKFILFEETEQERIPREGENYLDVNGGDCCVQPGYCGTDNTRPILTRLEFENDDALADWVASEIGFLPSAKYRREKIATDVLAAHYSHVGIDLGHGMDLHKKAKATRRAVLIANALITELDKEKQL